MNKTIEIKQIPNDILTNEYLDDTDEFDNLCSEASATKALAFFDIIYDSEAKTLTYPDALDLERAEKIVNQYLEDIEEEEFPPNSIAFKYNKYTEPFRGADDGTYDYVGTYVSSILAILIALSVSK